MTVVAIYMRMDGEQEVTIIRKKKGTETETIFKGENKDIPLELLYYYVYNIKSVGNVIQITIRR